MPRYWILLLIVSLLAVTSGQNVFADSSSSQPLLGFTWPTHSIPVLINSSLPNATRSVRNAMLTWNLAQQWFITTYMSGVGTPILFYETNSSSDSIVRITFNQTQTTDDLGWTNSQEFRDQQGVFVKVDVEISIDLAWKDGKALTDAELQTLATHELGHALGLDHTTFNTSDLMNQVPTVMFPSTLNLFAVYLLSRSTSVNDLPQQPVTLPGIIPYAMVSQDELDRVTIAVVQTVTTSTASISQLISASGPWPYLAFPALLAGVVVLLTVRGRRRKISVHDSEDAQVIFHDNPTTQVAPVQTEQTKKTCRHCRGEIPRHVLICRKCGMPVS